MADKPSDKPEKSAPRKPLSVVPVGEAYSNLTDDKFRWQVNVDNFGGLARGQKVGAVHLQPGTPIEWHVEQGNLIPLTVDESAEASVNENPIVPPYGVANLQPAKPVLPPAQAHTLEDAAKVDDAKKAEDARAAEAAKAKHEADVKAKADADEKAKADAIAKAKAEMTGEKK